MSALVEIILPVFMVIGLGYAAVWRGVFIGRQIDALMTFAQRFAIPLLLFRAISTLDLGAGYDIRLLASYYTGSVASFALGLFGARVLFARGWSDSVAIGFAAFFANTVLLGLPITERAYGAGALAPTYAIISVHSPFCYLLGITSMEVVRGMGNGIPATAGAVLRAMFRNTLVLAIGLGFIVNLSGWDLPGPVAEGFDLMIRAALPTALFALGGVLYQYRPEGDLRVVLWVCTISLVIHPLIALAIGTRVFSLPDTSVKNAVLTAAMAPGINAYIFANLYKSAKRVAAASVLAGTLLSVVSVTFWLVFLGG